MCCRKLPLNCFPKNAASDERLRGHGLYLLALRNLLIETERLSARHSEKLGTRSLDILHVAMAVVLGCERFLSFDIRQVKLARAAGLKVVNL